MGLFFWRKKKDEPQPVTDAQAEKEEWLRTRFNQASFGSLFRTNAYTLIGDAALKTKTEWLEAREEDGAWDIWRLSRLDNVIEGVASAINQEADPKRSGLTFFVAVEELSSYENGKRMASDMPSEEAEKHFDASLHVKIFAENEGIAFDVNGMPHPTTEDGKIVVNGTFPPEAYTKAKEVAERKRVTVEGLPAAAAPTFNLTSSFTVSLNELSDPINEILASLYELQEFTREAVAQGWGSYIVSDKMKKGFQQYGQHVYLTEEGANETLIYSLEKHAQNSANKVSDRSLRAEIGKAWNTAVLSVILAYTRENHQKLGKAQGRFVYNDDKLDMATDVLFKYMRWLKQEPPEKDSPILNKMLSEPTGYPKELDAVIEWFEILKASREQKIEAELVGRNGQKLLPPSP